MADSQQYHSHYWPGEGCIPITPQARQLGWTYDVYVTHSVWGRCITWTKGKNTNPDRRIFQLLESCWDGMGKALSSEPERVMYQFKHWYWRRNRPKAKKKVKGQFAARLLLHPQTEEPWILIFDPLRDNEGVLEHGEPEEHREHEGGDRDEVPECPDYTQLDIGPETV